MVVDGAEPRTSAEVPFDHRRLDRLLEEERLDAIPSESSPPGPSSSSSPGPSRTTPARATANTGPIVFSKLSSSGENGDDQQRHENRQAEKGQSTGDERQAVFH